jgi:hypothetical protein
LENEPTTGVDEMNLTRLTKRIEAIEQRTADKVQRRKVVRRIWQDGKLVGGYAGEITPDMLVIERVIVSPCRGVESERAG